MLNSKKKILFSAYSLEVGGIETALVDLVNYLYNLNYDITIVLEKKAGELLNKLNENITVIEYSPSYNKLFGKIINAKKRIEFIKKYKNKFNASFAYATYCKMASFTARTASENCSLWVHGSYLDIFKNNVAEYKQFFESLNINEFKNIIFVSEKSKQEFEKIFNKANTLVCNNIINYERIQTLAKEKIDLKKSNTYTFLYVGRITEESKKVSRIIETVKILKNKNINFRIIVIGDGKDLKKIKEEAVSNHLENNIMFAGKISNPYPYFKISDALLLVSENEGYPVVYNEARVLQLPILTTNVSDSPTDIEGKYGIVCNQNVQDIAEKMEELINNKNNGVISNLEHFNAEEYNKNIANKIENIVNERN